jgi:hypothetical protein
MLVENKRDLPYIQWLPRAISVESGPITEGLAIPPKWRHRHLLKGEERPANLGSLGSEGVEGAEPGSGREGPRWPRPRRDEAASAAATGGGGGSNPRRWGRSRGVPRQTRRQQGWCLVPAPPEQRRGHPATHRGRRRGPATGAAVCGGSRTVATCERGLEMVCVGGLGATCRRWLTTGAVTRFCAKSGVYPLEMCDPRTLGGCFFFCDETLGGIWLGNCSLHSKLRHFKNFEDSKHLKFNRNYIENYKKL